MRAYFRERRFTGGIRLSTRLADAGWKPICPEQSSQCFPEVLGLRSKRGKSGVVYEWRVIRPKHLHARQIGEMTIRPSGSAKPEAFSLQMRRRPRLDGLTH